MLTQKAKKDFWLPGNQALSSLPLKESCQNTPLVYRVLVQYAYPIVLLLISGLQTFEGVSPGSRMDQCALSWFGYVERMGKRYLQTTPVIDYHIIK